MAIMVRCVLLHLFIFTFLHVALVCQQMLQQQNCKLAEHPEHLGYIRRFISTDAVHLQHLESTQVGTWDMSALLSFI